MKKGSVIIVGAGPGLGSSLARKFAKEGHHVFVARRERNASALEELSNNINSSGGTATAIPTDARDEDQVIKLFAKVSEQGQIDRVIFNIGANVFFSNQRYNCQSIQKGLGNGNSFRFFSW